MIDFGFFGNTMEFRKKWEKGSKEMFERWKGNSTALNKKRIEAIKVLSEEKRISDLEERLDFKYLILTQKLEHLKIAESTQEIDQILAEPKKDKTFKIPINSLYWMIEEECLFWQRASLEAPLSHEGLKRYVKVFAAFCKKYEIDNPINPEEDISDIPILSIEDIRAAKGQSKMNNQKEDDEQKPEQLLLF